MSDVTGEALEVARQLAAMGVPIFTAAPRAGRPGEFHLPREWQRTRARREAVDAWRPGMALCAVTGVVYDVIDIDPRNGGHDSFQQVVSLLPRGYGRTLTPSGGTHNWIKTLGLAKRTGLLPGIDYQGGAADGSGRGFVYLPPTARPSKAEGADPGVGVPYRWAVIPQTVMTAELAMDDSAGAFRQLVRGAGTGDGGDGGSSGYTDPDLDRLLTDGIPPDASHELTLRDVVWKLVARGEGDGLIGHVYREIIRRTPLKDPSWEWDDEDLRRHLDGARRKLGKPTGGDELWLLAGGLLGEVGNGGEDDEDGDGDGDGAWYRELLTRPEFAKRVVQRRFDLETERRLRVEETERRRATAVVGERPVLDGEGFIFDEVEELPAIWGAGEQVLWVRDEGLMICGPQGVGKTVLMQNLLLRRVGVRGDEGELLGHRIAVDEDEDAVYLYLAMDRPAQARRAIRRMLSDNSVDRGIARDRLRFWTGPLPVNVLDEPETLVTWAAERCGRVPAAIFCDSYKDLAVGLSKDEVGAQLNLMVQAVIAAGCQWVGAHHHRKGDGQRTPRSIDDVYGSTWITSGLGSVLMVWGEPGDLAIELSQLKDPADKIDPVSLLHDPETGWLRVDEETHRDPLTVLRSAGDLGVTATELATMLYDGANAAQRARATRALNGLVERGLAVKLDGEPAPGQVGRPAARYVRLVVPEAGQEAG